MIVQDIPVPPTPPPVPEIPDFVMGPFLTGDDIAKIVFLSMAGLVLVVWIVARGPIGQAIGGVITRWLGGGSRQELPAELDTVVHRLNGMEQQLGELAERQDFTERMLAQVRAEKKLPGAGDVQR